MPPPPTSRTGLGPGFSLAALAAMVTGCSLLVESALADKDAGAGGSGASTQSASGSGAGTGSASSGSTASSASSGSSGGEVPCDGGTTCTLTNATGACSQGQCVIVACAKNYADCDKTPGDGCEVDLNTDHDNCGQCTQPCNPSQICKGGKCK